MITIDLENCLIFVRGIHSMAKIEQVFLQQTGMKRWNWRRYTIVGLADDNAQGLQSALPYHPVEPQQEVGFRYTRKNEPSTRPDPPSPRKRRTK